MLKAILLSLVLTGLTSAGVTNAQVVSAAANQVHRNHLHAATVPSLIKKIRVSGTPAQIDYRGTCEASDSDIISYPDIAGYKMITQRASAIKSANSSEGAHQIHIARSKSFLHVSIGHLENHVLATRILKLHLIPDTRYDPSEAISAIENAKEVQSALKKSHIRIAVRLTGMESLPVHGAPHLNRTLQNLTVSQALDNVARTFSGIVIYGECTRPKGEKLITIYFISNQF